MLRRRSQQFVVERLALRRQFHLSPLRRREPFDPANVERAEDEVDVCIVGAGPAGLSAAIRLKQLEQEKGKEIRVVVLEKGSEVGGSHQCLSPFELRQARYPRITYSVRCCYRTNCPQRTFPPLEGSFRSSVDTTHYFILDAILHRIILFSDPPPTANEQQGKLYRLPLSVHHLVGRNC